MLAKHQLVHFVEIVMSGAISSIFECLPPAISQTDFNANKTLFLSQIEAIRRTTFNTLSICVVNCGVDESGVEEWNKGYVSFSALVDRLIVEKLEARTRSKILVNTLAEQFVDGIWTDHTEVDFRRQGVIPYKVRHNHLVKN